MSEFQKEELSLEETNKLRISLGLKPLVADDGEATAPSVGVRDAEGTEAKTSSDRLDPDAQAAKNFQQRADEERRQREDAQLKERLAKAQAKREAARRLKGPTLADPEPSASSASTSTAIAPSSDTLKWLKESKKRAKEHAARRAREIEEQEAQEQAQYGERDLAGLRVAHGFEDFDEGEERVLTLKDSGVLDEADDELMDAALQQAEQDKRNLERKKGLKAYSGLDDQEAETGRKTSILAKYDADLPEDMGLSKDADAGGFTLGSGTAAIDRKDRTRKEAEEAAKLANKQLLSLDYAKNQDVSDYLQEGEVGFKKPKVKKRKKAAKVKLGFDAEDDDATSAQASTSAVPLTEDVVMEDIKVAPRQPRQRQTENFVDDDELQASLARSRRQKAKKTFSKTTPEMIARNLAAQKAVEDAEKAALTSSSTPLPADATANGTNGFGKNEPDNSEHGLTFDETSEFVRAIRDRPLEDDTRRMRSIKRESVQREDSISDVRIKKEDTADADDVPMQTFSMDGVDLRVKKEEELDESMDLRPDSNESVDRGGATPSVKPEVGEDEEDTAEPMVGRGLASTLSFLRHQGMLPQYNAELKTREEQQKRYDAWLAERRREEAAREASRQASKASGSSIDQATRESQNRNRELEDARMAQDRFKDYKPDVEIKYHDEFGRDLDQKEAWKHLSHVFHGKKPGTKKMEKRLKKIEDEKKRERMAAGDTPTGMLSAFQNRTERTGQAHMVLSVGSRGAAPQDNDLLGGGKTIELKKPAAKGVGKGKGKDSRSATNPHSGDMISPLPMNGSDSIGSNTTNGGVATTTTKAGGGGWTKVGSATPAAPGANGASTAVAGGGFKPITSTNNARADSVAPEPSNGEARPAGAAGSAPFRLALGVKRKAGEE